VRYLWITLLSVVNSLSFAQSQTITKEVESMNDRAITKVVPVEYAAYRNSLTGEKGLNDARASVRLLSQAREVLAKVGPSVERKKEEFDGYLASWHLCLRLTRESHDQAARQFIVGEWNRCLKVDGDAVCAQLYALIGNWDRDLLTDDFWRLFQETKNPETILAFSVLLLAHGNETDIQRMAEKLESNIDGESKNVLKRAMSYRKLKLEAPDHPGPAQLAPSFKYPSFDKR